MNSLGIGLAGFGMIGRVHALAYAEISHYYPNILPPISLSAVCTTRPESAQQAAREGGFHAWTTSLTELASRDDVQIVDVCLPNDRHLPAILAALRAGKPVLVDKPLVLTADQALEIEDAARLAKIPVGMIFNYRFIPAILQARQMLTDGALGEIYHFSIDYLHTGYQNPQRPMSWRLRQSRAGGGALVDLGSHIIDLARYLIGEFDTLTAHTRTYVNARPASANSSHVEPVDVDDAAWLNAKMRDGSSGTLFVTRFATGSVDDLSFQIYGERGALKFSLQDANVLQWYDAHAATPGWTRLPTGTTYAGAAVPPPRSILGWNRTHAENIYQFLRAVVANEPFSPDVTDGARAQQVIDAAYQSAAENHAVAVPRS